MKYKFPPPPGKQLFSIELTSKRGVKYLLKWLKKYLIIAKQEIEKNNFIPTLTGGMDTRTLTWFWRDLYAGTEYYLKSIKPDGHNNAVRGREEILSSSKVLNRLGKILTRTENLKQKTTFYGSYTECGHEKKAFNNPEFFYDYVSLHKNVKFYSMHQSVCPFVDNLYLQLRHPQPYYARILLALLLCPQLLDIPLYTFNDKPSYKFKKKFCYLIPEVEQFIAKYNLRERVAKIKAKILNQPFSK